MEEGAILLIGKLVRRNLSVGKINHSQALHCNNLATVYGHGGLLSVTLQETPLWIHIVYIIQILFRFWSKVKEAPPPKHRSCSWTQTTSFDIRKTIDTLSLAPLSISPLTPNSEVEDDPDTFLSTLTRSKQTKHLPHRIYPHCTQTMAYFSFWSKKVRENAWWSIHRSPQDNRHTPASWCLCPLHSTCLIWGPVLTGKPSLL